MDRGRRLAPLVCVVHMNRIGIPVPRQPSAGGRMVVPEIPPDNPRPMLRELERRLTHRLLLDRENSPRTQDRNTFAAGVALVEWIPGNDARALRRREVKRVLDRH